MVDFVAGDTGSSIEVPCTDKQGNVINLAGCSVKLRWKDQTGTLVSKDMTIDDPVNGLCSYKFGEDELFAPGMTFEVQITDIDDSKITILDLINAVVRKPLA